MIIRRGQGTLTVAVNAFTPSDPVIRRTLTPYGTPVGGGEGTWPDNRAFLNDPSHSSTGLVDVGARKYDPATGTFISVDPILDTSSPQAMNGYVYGGGDPVNNADPSGEMYVLSGGGAGGLHAVRFRAAAARQAYHRLANQVENRQLNHIWEVDPNPRLIVQHIRQWTHPGYARTQVSQYAAARRVRYRREQAQAAARATQAVRAHRGCGFFSFACSAAHFVEHHWRGIAQVGIIGGGILCVASAVCGAIAGAALGVAGVTSATAVTVGAGVLAGSAVGAADYATSGGKHTAEGYAVATFEGGAGGLIGGGWSLAAKMAGAKLGVAFAGALALRGSAGLEAYNANTPSDDRTLRGEVNAFVLGSGRGLSTPVRAILDS